MLKMNLVTASWPELFYLFILFSINDANAVQKFPPTSKKFLTVIYILHICSSFIQSAGIFITQ